MLCTVYEEKLIPVRLRGSSVVIRQEAICQLAALHMEFTADQLQDRTSGMVYKRHIELSKSLPLWPVPVMAICILI